MTISRLIILRITRRQNQNTHFMFNNFLPRKSCISWDNVEEHGRARKTTVGSIIRRMCFTCWINKATNTLRLRNTYYFSIKTTVIWKRLDVTWLHFSSLYQPTLGPHSCFITPPLTPHSLTYCLHFVVLCSSVSSYRVFAKTSCLHSERMRSIPWLQSKERV
jgi:hypothetical protein